MYIRIGFGTYEKASIVTITEKIMLKAVTGEVDLVLALINS